MREKLKEIKNLDRLRKGIDKVDSCILGLLNLRAQLAIIINKLKEKEGYPTYSPSREKEIIDKLINQNKGPFPNLAIEDIYRQILSYTRSLISPIKVSYLGPEGSFSHLAAQKHFGEGSEFIPYPDIRGVFSGVERREVDFGVVPVESSAEGMVTHTLDMFMESELKMVGEIQLEVSYHLMSNSPLNKIKKVYSHPHAFTATKGWLRTNLFMDVQYIETYSTAEAVKHAAKEEGAAAIGAEIAAKLYNIPIIARNLEDKLHYTRFLVIAKEELPSSPSTRNKTSLLISIKDRVGALHDILAPFKDFGINLTKIESHPNRSSISSSKIWDYVFFLDFLGHKDEPHVKKTLAKIKSLCINCKILGSYPAA
jgi:chorismate mutase/prephenate dehydratase